MVSKERELTDDQEDNIDKTFIKNNGGIKKQQTERRRISAEQLDKLCELRQNNLTHKDFNKATGRDNYLIRMTRPEYHQLLKHQDGIDNNRVTKRLFFDIETSPIIAYTWRVGYKLNISYENIIEDWKIITICYKWEGENDVHALVWDSEKDDKQLLMDFVRIANSADELIGHNGDRFDIKKIRTRCIYHRVPMFPKYRSLDTLKKARGGFAFDSNKLDAIAKYLGVGAKLEHEGFPMWVKCLHNDKEALDNMVKYCKVDVVVLEDVYTAMQHYIKPNSHAGVANGGTKYSCPICGCEEIELIKNDVTEKGTISRVVKCKACKHHYNISNLSYMKYLTRRTSND